MIQITDFPRSLRDELTYYRKNYDNFITASEFIKKQGMSSCEYSVCGKYWKLNEVDYTLFVWS